MVRTWWVILYVVECPRQTGVLRRFIVWSRISNFKCVAQQWPFVPREIETGLICVSHTARKLAYFCDFLVLHVWFQNLVHEATREKCVLVHTLFLRTPRYYNPCIWLKTKELSPTFFTRTWGGEKWVDPKKHKVHGIEDESFWWFWWLYIVQ